jgi:hypothetical protein
MAVSPSPGGPSGDALRPALDTLGEIGDDKPVNTKNQKLKRLGNSSPKRTCKHVQGKTTDTLLRV